MSVTKEMWADRSLENDVKDAALHNVTHLRLASESEDEQFAANLRAVVQRVSGTSIAEIDGLVEELQVLRHHLEREGARVQRAIAQFATLSQSSIQSTNAIRDTLNQMKKVVRLPSQS